MNLILSLEIDSNAISILHYQYINKGFLRSLGKTFLKLMYQSMVNSQYAFCISAEIDGKIVGFILGTVNIGEFYKEFLIKNFFKVGMILLTKLLNPKIVKKIFEALLYPLKQDKSLPDAELLSIVVDKDHQGKDISQKLFKELVKEFRSRSITQFKVVVGSNLIRACKFYEKMGGILSSEIEVHRGEKSRVYVWEI